MNEYEARFFIDIVIHTLNYCYHYFFFEYKFSLQRYHRIVINKCLQPVLSGYMTHMILNPNK